MDTRAQTIAVDRFREFTPFTLQPVQFEHAVPMFGATVFEFRTLAAYEFELPQDTIQYRCVYSDEVRTTLTNRDDVKTFFDPLTPFLLGSFLIGEQMIECVYLLHTEMTAEYLE
jgi:hypothetical protein